ncbi:MAG TPA: hypothetical protein VFC56_08090 [Stellaceae bacterium]|nr:hypothetical protein [Stellaceae bacterium]
MTITDAIVYRQIAAELGRFPPDVNRWVVTFYSDALEVSRLADGAVTTQAACVVITDLASRLKFRAAILLRIIDKFQAADFATSTNIQLEPDEVRQFARESDYPFEEVLREHGLTLRPQGGPQ